MCYQVERVCEQDEVILRFLKIESQKSGAVEWQNLLDLVQDMRGDQLRRHLRDFAERIHCRSPIIPWTVGMNDDESHRSIRRWVYADTDLEQFYTCGINDRVRPCLMKAQWNLKRFLKYAPDFEEFKLDWIPTELLRVMFGIARREIDKNGTIQLIDGAHRTISMLHNNISRSKAFIGEI
jgi:hypothetical protein